MICKPTLLLVKTPFNGRFITSIPTWDPGKEVPRITFTAVCFSSCLLSGITALVAWLMRGDRDVDHQVPYEIV